LAALLGLFRTNPGLTPKRIGLGKPTVQFGERSVRLAWAMRAWVQQSIYHHFNGTSPARDWIEVTLVYYQASV
jgi:hypothetical protein